MTDEKKIEYLLQYIHELATSLQHGHKCSNEIKNATDKFEELLGFKSTNGKLYFTPSPLDASVSINPNTTVRVDNVSNGFFKDSTQYDTKGNPIKPV